MSTLVAVLALTGVRQGWAERATAAGSVYLARHGQDWRGAAGETVGFELVAPYLAEQVAALGLPLVGGLDVLAELRNEKLSRVSLDVLTQKPTPLLYSAEALQGLVPIGDLAAQRGESGAMWNNPAATAALWLGTGDVKALAYLRQAAGSTGGSGMPEIYPIDVFEPAWVLYALSRAGLSPPRARGRIERLAALAVTARGGMAVSSDIAVPDSDDTAMVANVLHAHGYDDTALLDSLPAFETATHFAGFPYERGAPTSANARVLEALSRRPDRFGPQIGKVRSFLLDTRHEGGWWTDKWHLSAYYATAQVVFGMSTVAPRELAGTRRWLLDSQHGDGSWGMAGGLPEETAYAVLALHALEPYLGPVPTDTYRRAHAFLLPQLAEETAYAELWVGKGLYTPSCVVRAAILAATALALRAAS